MAAQPLDDAWYGHRNWVNITEKMKNTQLVNMSYLSTRYSIPSSETFFILGVYYCNQPYAGDGTRIGAMVGAEWEILKDKISLLGDYKSGTSKMSVINLGVEWAFTKSWQLDLAYQLPSPRSGNPQAVVLQLGKK